MLETLIDFILHIEVHLDMLITQYQTWTYLILFLIIFVETGLIVMPFLPGDSLLFAIGAFTARGAFDLWAIMGTLVLAAFLGDIINYSIGKYFGPKIFGKENSFWFNKKNLEKAHRFYEKYGAKTIILARFVPIVRTFAPFVAGIGEMNYRKYMIYNIVGAVLWVCSFTVLGFFFGNLPIIQKNFKLVILAIIIISVIPAVVEYVREKKKLSSL